MAPCLSAGTHLWSVDSGDPLVHLELFYTLSLLLLVLLLISCGTCIRESAEFSTDGNCTEHQACSQLLHMTLLDDGQYRQNICMSTSKEGSPHSRKVSWQNEGPSSHESAMTQPARALPEIPGSAACGEDLEGKADPVFSKLAELCQLQDEEEDREQPYATSRQLGLETARAEVGARDEAGGEESGKPGPDTQKVMVVYARVSKKQKSMSGLVLLDLTSPPKGEELQEEPPPIPEKRFADGDLVATEMPGQQGDDGGITKILRQFTSPKPSTP
ncbi:uncharacterized protein [Narcine bancroftii]|uniref:uncharacterized protein isoform X2 n=1 Tax=Narcine bancroftii TaxID=1343680 RepID=UPI00383122B0